ncbi:MAG TPA: RagB/SusD family nutrient uptake outer membrane protein [Haliscomenobacter sp.]|mgnify:CR=1 FL=1|uniref:RagB/SusD family nutrient uptake outer membrane protein n=1 Tax=Haliscomenobacter sp. TaxID=2717303 RepID=UPI002C0396F1|nr:RagB/SusD family nutrient uptake outer membrane protein [Haliscomenobacter sp.]HOY20567.1 RagB/SusD family nutrient uptake outer membrane protein [Haliscomenobacter sp.]
MKKNLFFFFLGICFFLSSCLSQLEEDVRSQVTDSHLSTAAGFQEAVNASYASLKTVFCALEDNGIIPLLTTFGTDTYTNGFDGGFKMMNFYNSDLNPRTNAITFNWNNLYTAINTCNAVVSRAPNVTGLTDAVKNTRVAEVRFIRAEYYFLLVQLFGPVHLSLSETTGVQTTATRSPVKDIYDAIVQDLEFAIQNLPINPAQYGRVAKPAAENLLAMVYLARATSEAKQAQDYAKAAELAKGVISKYNFKLLDDFAKIFEQGSAEKNAEVIWAIQNTKDVIANGPGNTMHLYFIMKYDDLIGMQRDIANGRPYARYKPTDFVLNTLFDRQLDSRYEKSFKRVFYCNKPGTYTINGKSVVLAAGDTAVYLPDREWSAAEISRAKYSVFPPSRQNERVFPTLIKHLDPQRQGINDQPGSRDFLFFRLAETYLVAAEALLMSGNSAEAATYINMVRRRAAKSGATPAETEANRLAMEITPNLLTLDFVLDERARELLGEGNRWIDLVRTGKLIERVKKYNPVAAANIKDFHVLRPIPQQQIDRTEGEFKQNPGY